MELNRLHEQHSFENKAKSIVLKASTKKKGLSEDEKDLDQDESLSLLTNKLVYCLEKNRDRAQFKNMYASKPNDSSYANYTCFGCGKPDILKWIVQAIRTRISHKVE